MRVTNGMLASNFLNNLNRTMGRMQTYQQQLATNKRITRLSDDPIGAINSLSIRGKISRLDQYEKNIGDAKAWLTQSETAVMELNDVLKTLYEKTVQASTGTNSAQQKQAIAHEMTELRDHIVQLANSGYGDKFIFGGFQTTAPPFAYDNGQITYQGLDMVTLAGDADLENYLNNQVIQYEIGTNLQSDISISGVRLLGTGEDNIIHVLDDLITKLNNHEHPDELSPFIEKLQNKQDHVLGLATEIGGKMNRLELMENRYSLDKLNYETVKGNIEDIDMAEVTMQFKMTESVYMAALSVGSRIIQPSLIDFLR